MPNKFALRLIPTLIGIAFAGGAGAAGFQLIEQNTSGIGTAFAGSAAIAENASTIFYNPAGMTQLQTHEVSVGMAAIRPSFKFSNDASDTMALNNTGNGGDGGDWGFVPDAYLSWVLNKDIYLGLGIGVPFGLQTQYDSPWIGAAQSTKFQIKTININPSIAYRVNNVLSLGFGVNWQKLDAEYLRTAGVYPQTVGANVRLNLSDDAWGWNAGALFNLSPTTKVGVSYRSTIKYSATGQITTSGFSGASASLNDAKSGPAKASIEFPDTFILSGTHLLNDRWELLGDISWTGWSSIPKVDVITTNNGNVAQSLGTKFRDTWRFAVGGKYKVNDAWKVKLGLAYDQTPVKDASSRLVSLPDNNRTWFSLGGQWSPVKGTTVDFGAAYLYVKDARIHSDESSASPLTNRGVVDGIFKDNAWVFGAQYSVAF